MLRVLSGIGGFIVAVAAFFVSFGAALGAPIGLAFARRSARRRNREATRLGLFFGSMTASAITGIAIWGVLAAFIPQPSQKALNSAVDQAQARRESRLPEWYSKTFPQAVSTDSATNEMLRSPRFYRAFMLFIAAMIGAFLGAVGGSLGWCASGLLTHARAPAIGGT
ncbi:MAG TPA: hypothetical protein VKQ05_03560 [Gemmatimonadales bacterium]|nr:hypothetical protein [Gemmatimonadales bacterium]